MRLYRKSLKSWLAERAKNPGLRCRKRPCIDLILERLRHRNRGDFRAAPQANFSMIFGIYPILILSFTIAAAGWAAPADHLRHELNNQAEEIRILTARLATQESLIESLREDIRKIEQASLETCRDEAKNTQSRISNLELKVDGIERQQGKAIALLDQSQRRLETLDNSLTQQNKNSRHLEKSLTTLLDAVSNDSSSPNSNGASLYCVVSGDSLEKLAKRFKTSVQAIKELNGLDHDRIIVGKKLKIPPSSS